MHKKEKNHILKNLSVTKIGYGGRGIASLPDKKKVLIAGGVVPGMIVDVCVTKKKKDYVEAIVLHVHNEKDIEGLQNPLCPHCRIPFLKEGKKQEGDEKSNDKKENTDQNPLFSSQQGCGGCKRQHLLYETQCNLKVKIISDSFRNCPHVFDTATLYDIISSPKHFYYRNKIEFSFGKYISEEIEKGAKKNSIFEEWNLGFHKQGQFSKVIDVKQCYLISPSMHEIFVYLKNLCKNSGLPVYDQKKHTGFFRHLVIREGTNTNQILVNLVVATKGLQQIEKKEEKATPPKANNCVLNFLEYEKLYKNFLKTLQENQWLRTKVKTFCITENNGLADIVKSQDAKTVVLWGDGYIYETLHLKNEEENDQNNQTLPGKSISLHFRISPFSFFQTNTKGTEILFKTASKHVGEIKGTIIDLYCGTGSIGLSFLAQGKGNFVIGIEVNEEAIIDAKYNAQLNNMENQTYFVVGKVEKIIQTDPYIKEKLPTVGLIIVDPPREGLHKNVIKFLCNLKQKHMCKLLYISCNPVTIARDIDLLVKGGWKLDIFQPVDMFPQTHHVETIGVLK